MIPLILVTGFLGSGKTSFLRRMIPLLREGGLTVRVILNDFANATIDAGLLEPIANDVLPITGSCICCSSGEDLIAALHPTPIVEPGAVLVEANGTTDPFQLLEMLLLSPVGASYPALLQVVLVDQKRWQKRYWNNELERLQTRTASHVIFGYHDLTTEARRADVVAHVRKLNPRAKFCGVEDFAKEVLGLAVAPASQAGLTSLALPSSRSSELKFLIRPLPGAAKSAEGPSMENPFAAFPGTVSGAGNVNSQASSHHAMAHRFQAFQLEIPLRVRRERLMAWLSSLPINVLRAKGVVEFAHRPGEFQFFQKVEDTVDFDEVILPPRDGKSLALMIGADLDEPALRRQALEMLHEKIG